MKRLRMRRLAWVVPVLMTASMVTSIALPIGPAAAAAPKPKRTSVPVQPAGAAPKTSVAAATAKPLARPVWPSASETSVNLSTMSAHALSGGTASAGSVTSAKKATLPPAIRVGRATTGSSPASVDVKTLSATTVTAAGGIGVGAVVTRTDGKAVSGAVKLSVSYRGFAAAYGANFAERLQLVQVPACALTTPAVSSCLTRTYLHAVNDAATQTVTATVQASASPAVSSRERDGSGTAAASGSVVMLAAGTSSVAGDFRATDINQSGEWTVSPGSGAFEYSIPIAVPPPPTGPTPNLALGYNSQSVDGLTSGTNDQADSAGLGWALTGSFIQRHYRTCSDDGAAASVGDLCWDSPYQGTDAGHAGDSFYTIVLNGVSSNLVRDASDPTVFHLQQDTGWRVQDLTGATNGARNGEYWLVSTPDGTRYYFGFGKRLTDNAATNSVASAPVFGNNSGEPCYTTGTLSPCSQPYRWMLDRVIDPNENDSAYMYWDETNNYYSTMGTATERSYTSAIHLGEIDYGRSDFTGAGYADKVAITYAGRCTQNMADQDPAHTPLPGCPSVAGSPSSFPDVPTDLMCAAGDSGKCASHAAAPTFFTAEMLSTITTYVIPDGVPADASKVMVYQLKHQLQTPATGSSGTQLWLAALQTVAFAGTTSMNLPSYVFYGANSDNALSTSVDLEFMRLTKITDNMGATTSVVYGYPDGCHAASPPTPATNTQDCFEEQSTTQGGSQTWSWYNKLMTESVSSDPGYGFGSGHDGDPVQTTTYTYPTGKAGWAFATDPTMKRTNESWTVWRGYPSMTTTTGSAPQKRTTVDYLFRGLDGDRKVVAPTGPGDYKSVTATGTSNSTVVAQPDSLWLAGRVLEEVTEDTTGAPQVETIHHYTNFDTASYNGTPDSEFAWEDVTTTLSKLSTSTADDATWRGHVVKTTYDTTNEASKMFGLPVSVEDDGDSAVTGDETCTTYGYAFNTDIIGGSTQDFWFALPDDTRHYGSTCASRTGQDGQNIVLYDGAATESANHPVDGNATSTTTNSGPAATITTAATYDTAGRVVSSTDGNGHVTTTSYSPTANWPTAGVTVTTPAPDPSGHTGSATGLATKTVSSPSSGQPTSTTDPNGHTTTMAYDPAGRLTAAWNPTDPTSGPASFTASYVTPVMTLADGLPTVPDGPSVITTKLLQNLTPTYLETDTYLDGLGRTREVQQPNPSDEGGRVVTSTRYNDAGDIAGTNPIQFFNSSDPGTGMVNPTIASLPSYQATTADYSGRVTETQLLAAGVAQTAGVALTRYAGADYSAATDPDGNVTNTYTDALGRTSKIVQLTPDLSPTSITTSYTYTDTGQLATITDAAGNRTAYGYDWLSRQTSMTDPDRGASTTTFDNDGNTTATVDANGQKLTTVYDALSRPTATWLGVAGTGTQINSIGYDTASNGRGRPATSTSFSGGNSYVSSTDGYDADGRATGTTITIPAVEGALAGTYDTTAGYDDAGHQTTVGYPGVGTGTAALPAETVTTDYYLYGLPNSVTSSLTRGLSYGGVGYLDYQGHAFLRNWGVDGAGPSRTFTWNPATGALSNITTTIGIGTGATTVQNDVYWDDNAGNVLEVADKVAGQQQCFGYDDLGRLSAAYTASMAPPGSCGPATPSHTGTPTPYDLRYSYDNLGDITSVADKVAATTSTYSYADSHHVHAVTAVAHSAGTTDQYGYNADGAMNSRTIGGSASTMTWTPQQHLASITGSGGTTSYVYGVDGTMLLRKSPSGTTLYLPGQELSLVGTVVTPTRTYTSGGTTMAMRVGGGGGNGTLTWLAADSQGSAQLAINSTTKAVTRQRYTPFGAQLDAQGPPAGSQRGYLGQDYDPASGLLQDGARLYDPSLGRFLSTDPILVPTTPQDLSSYSYAYNNPETDVDPSGLGVLGPGGSPSCPSGIVGDCDDNYSYSPYGGNNSHSPHIPITGVYWSNPKTNPYTHQPCGYGPALACPVISTVPVPAVTTPAPNAPKCLPRGVSGPSAAGCNPDPDPDTSTVHVCKPFDSCTYVLGQQFICDYGASCYIRYIGNDIPFCGAGDAEPCGATDAPPESDAVEQMWDAVEGCVEGASTGTIYAGKYLAPFDESGAPEIGGAVLGCAAGGLLGAEGGGQGIVEAPEVKEH